MKDENLRTLFEGFLWVALLTVLLLVANGIFYVMRGLLP